MSNPAGTRQSIIDALLRIIARDGIAGVTNRRIAKEADVSLGSVTYHFETQHDLLREGLLYFVAAETRRFTRLADSCQAQEIDVDVAAATVGQLAGGESAGSTDLAPFEMYVQAGRDERLRAAATECFAVYDLLATRVLAGLGVPDAERLAGTVVALVLGLRLRGLATGSPVEELADGLMLVIRGARNA